MLLDIGLPGIDGFEVCRRIAGGVPVIMLTARDEEPDRVAGLEVGADDYVSKPFSPRELTARVKAVLRRAGPGRSPRMSARSGPSRSRAAPGRYESTAPRSSSPSANSTCSNTSCATRARSSARDQLLESVWGFLAPGETRTVEVHVAQLRKKLGHPDLIKTIRGIGYKASG